MPHPRLLSETVSYHTIQHGRTIPLKHVSYWRREYHQSGVQLLPEAMHHNISFQTEQRPFFSGGLCRQ